MDKIKRLFSGARAAIPSSLRPSPALFACAALTALAVITVLVYKPVLNAGFVDFDDPIMVGGNWKINSVSLSNVKAVLFEYHIKLYHPLVNLSFFAESALFGKDPYFYHADNLILHLLNVLSAFLVFFILTRKNFFAAFITAALFACHPVNVESVAWITGRKDVLYAFFFLLSLSFWLKSYNSDGKSKRYYALSFVFFIFSCMSKSMAVTLPAVLVLLDWFSGRKTDKKSLLKYVPFFAVSAVFVFITYAGYYSPYEKAGQSAGTLFSNFVSSHFNVLFYVAKFVNPSKLSVIYPHHFAESGSLPDFIVYSPVLVYGILALALISLKKSKKFFFAAAWFLITVSPVIGIFPTGIAPVADRYVYIPFLGLAYIAAEFVIFLFKKIRWKFPRAVFVIFVCAVFLLMCAKANIQTKVWRDSETLFNNQIKNEPMRGAHAYVVRGMYYSNNQNKKAAERDFVSALSIDKNSSASFFLASIRQEEKKYEEAVKLYLAVPHLDANSTLAYCSLAKIYAILKDYEKAGLYIEKALNNKDNPTGVFAYFNAGNYYEDKEDLDKALGYYRKALELFPQDAAVYDKIGGIYEKKGEFEKAAGVYSDGLARSYDKVLLLKRLSKLLFERASYDAAERVNLKILEYNPDDYYACETLGTIRALKGDYKGAMRYFTTALLIKNDFASAYFYRAIVHFRNKRYYKAQKDVLSAQKYGFEIPEDFKEDLEKQMRNNI